MIEQVMDGVREATGQQLLLQIDREKPRTQIDRFVARHGQPPSRL